MDNKKRTAWFTDARFGMFIHWGLYSVTGGQWKGMDVPWISEWIMHKYAIPVAEYEELAKQFNPVGFNAEQWVSRIADAGMKYIVITAKHHDGFAMFRSKCDKYNVVDATPFKRDVMEELAEACGRHGIRLGFYYSQDQDWHEAGATGNFWDFPAERTPEMFKEYLERKAKPQLRELLTNYGDIGMIWFDTPLTISAGDSEDLRDFVHELQPGCLVSGRVGNGKGDYESLGDNQIPVLSFTHPAEGLGTMNDSWGYHALDANYRSTNNMLRTLGRMCARNANFLLNVGPDSSGRFPAPAVKRLREIGKFLKTNGEALYGAGDCGALLQPFTFGWGEVTAKKDGVYLWIFKRTGDVRLYGLRSKIARAYVMGENIPVKFETDHNDRFDYHKLQVELPDSLQTPYVIKLELAEELSVNDMSYFGGNTLNDKFTELAKA